MANVIGGGDREGEKEGGAVVNDRCSDLNRDKIDKGEYFPRSIEEEAGGEGGGSIYLFFIFASVTHTR